MRNENVELRRALKASLRLQAHYAAALNIHDGGNRMIFREIDAWLARLREVDERRRIARKEQELQFCGRAVQKRVPSVDGTEEVTLDCGHTIIRIIPSSADFMDCPECVNEYVEKHKSQSGKERA